LESIDDSKEKEYKEAVKELQAEQAKGQNRRKIFKYYRDRNNMPNDKIRFTIY